MEWFYSFEKIYFQIAEDKSIDTPEMQGKRLVFIVSLLWFCFRAEGQTDPVSTKFNLAYPVFSQYLQNGLIINPAYAGSRDVLSFFLSGREQWAGITGAPALETISLHTLLKNDRVGLGLTGQFMQFGMTSQTSVYADYAYHLRLGSGKLALGLKAGFDMSNTNYTIDFRNSLSSSISNPQATDPVFESGERYLLPNVGAGLYYYGKKFFAGASVPAFLAYERGSDGKMSFKALTDMEVLATAGALVTFAPSFKFKPSVFIDYSLANSKKMQIDLNGNFIIKDLIWIGASWRTSEKVAVGILQVQINPQLMVGYSYDYPVSSMSNFSKASHEVVIRYEFSYKVSAMNPRYF
jgi:type IX secretion system PorP/SprF family membrane protein